MNKKIAIFLPNLKVGGAERVIVTLANYFVKKNDVDIVLLKKEGELLKEIDPKIRAVSYTHLTLPTIR
ncbi:hypothetical protein CTM75_20700, partial [Photobacterium phosphoreum]